MTICEQFELDDYSHEAVISGEVPRGCISCANCDSFGRCRATGRGRDLPDGSYLSLSGRRFDWEDNDEEEILLNAEGGAE